MILTDEQFNALAPYEKYFETMVKAKWSRHPGNVALELIHSIHCQVMGHAYKMNKGCSNCISNLLSDMGTIYFKDKYEREQEIPFHPSVVPDDHKEVSVSTEIVGDLVVKKEVKTRKPRKPREKK